MAAQMPEPGPTAGEPRNVDIMSLAIGGPALDPVTAETSSPTELAELVQTLQARYRALAERLPAIVYVDAIDDISTNLYTSPQTLEILGIGQSEWMNNPELWLDMLHPDDRERVVEEHEVSNRNGEDFVSEYRLSTRDGRSVWIRDHAILVREENGTPRYWQGVMLDITDLKEAQRELAETQAKYKAIVEDIPAIVYIDEIDDDMSTSFVARRSRSCSGSPHRTTSTTRTSGTGCCIPKIREEALARYLHGRDSGESFEFEYRLIGRNDRTVWFRDRRS